MQGDQRWPHPTESDEAQRTNPPQAEWGVERLAERDLVLGPASDGGYWLIGLSARLLDAPERWPLSGIPWGGPEVCQSTLTAAWSAGLSTDLLPERQDVDHLSDLDPWLG
mgnify:CR=1 FL=1